MFRKILVSLALLIAAPAFGQNVQYISPVTRNHIPVWNTAGVLADGGSATDSPISSIGLTNEGGAAFCVSSQRQTAAGRNQLCFGASTAGPATISLQNYGTATAQNLQFVINGTAVTIPTGGGTFLFGNPPFTAGHVPCFVNSSGVIQDCGATLNNGTISNAIWQGSAIDIPFGGTNATTAPGARTNLGLGTIATQNANAVAITGGAITGMSNPSVGSDVANKSYVDATSSGLNILAPSRLATAAVLPNTPTYANGASGVGATLTSATNTTLTVDSTSTALNDVILVKNQAAPAQNGIYTQTQVGTGSVPWILTRATYFDQAAEMKAGSYTFVTAGSLNINSSWTLQTTITTVGTDAANFVQFSSGSSGSVTSVGTGTGLAGGPITTSGTVSCQQATNTQFGCIEPDGSTLTAAAGVVSANGSALPGVTPSSLVGATISIASPGVVTWSAHGLKANATVYFTTTGALPSGLTASTPATSTPTAYYVVGSSITATTFQVASSIANAVAGIAINTTGSQSGTHSAFANSVACDGCIGEWNYIIYPIQSGGGARCITNNTDLVWGQLPLKAGNWRFEAQTGIIHTGANTPVFSHMHADFNAIGQTTILTAPGNGSTTAMHITSNDPNGWIFPNGPVMFALAAPTTINAVVEVTVSGNPCDSSVYGSLKAQRAY